MTSGVAGFCDYCGEVPEVFPAPWMGVDYCEGCFIGNAEERVEELYGEIEAIEKLSTDLREKRYNREKDL